MKKIFFTLWILSLFACNRDPEGLREADCDDGKDNDLDGRYDCDDDGCAASTVCVNLARQTLEKEAGEQAVANKVKKKGTAAAALPETVEPVFHLSGLSVQRAQNGEDLKWEEAENYCAKLKLADKSDWRLPTKEEAVKIIESGLLKNEPSYVMWTSSRRGGNRAVIVGISGAVNEISVRSKGQCRARCVRGVIGN
jgi:hypothetical protein